MNDLDLKPAGVSEPYFDFALRGLPQCSNCPQRTFDVSAAAVAAHRATLVCLVARTTRGVAAMLLCWVRRTTRWGATKGCASTICTMLPKILWVWGDFAFKYSALVETAFDRSGLSFI